MRRFDAVIAGAGAAGLMCAIEAGKRGRRVAVLEHAERVGRKILISGGGRCNFTNIYSNPDNFLSANPHFAKSALARYTPADFVTLVEAYGIPYHEKTPGQLFCDRTARDITYMLEQECRHAGVTIFLNTSIREVRRTTEFVVGAGADEFRAPVLVVATGGLSIPKMGATGFGYGIARQFGLKIRECRPALVPFTFGREDRGRYGSLAGVSCEVIASIGKQRFREKMLFTHRGLSGPAILQISSYWTQGQPITVDLAPGGDLTPALLEKNRRDRSAAKSVLRGIVPARLAELWIDLNAPARWSNSAILELERKLHHWQVNPTGTEGYDKAEVTSGGVDTNELSARTMECRKQTGLYFIGEVVDVTGHLGGFNFQWAWASGACAGRAL
ncbi:MAG: NAD(P)/FAD-dependent oxidoreductase [Bryobacteraceae bacterium]|nr:NAD(P)/FAD-dependent oxidoreductase [Bryobacteraceae bacterium]